VLRDDPAYFQEMLRYWKAHLRASLHGARARAA